MKRLTAILAALFLAAQPCFAAPALVTSGAASDQTGGTGVTVSGLNTTGATLGVLCGVADTSSTSGTTVTDNKGNTWTRLYYQTSGSLQSEMWYSILTSVGTSTNITFAARYTKIAVTIYSGTKASSVLDGSTATNLVNSSNTSIQPGSVTPSQNGDLLVSCVMQDNDGTGSGAINSSFTKVNWAIGGGALGVGDAYYVQPTAGAINPTWSSYSAPYRTMASQQAFKDDSGGGGGGTAFPGLPLLGVGQ